MNQYCRYCNNANDYNGEGQDFVCTANAKCGNNGAGRFYLADKAKRTNKCKSFEFNPMDVFYATNGERYYKPKKKTKDEQKGGVQLLSQLRCLYEEEEQ